MKKVNHFQIKRGLENMIKTIGMKSVQGNMKSIKHKININPKNTLLPKVSVRPLILKSKENLGFILIMKMVATLESIKVSLKKS